MSARLARWCLTVWGRIDFARAWYRGDDGVGFSPVDAALGMRPHGHLSRGVRHLASYAGAVAAGSFALAGEMLEKCSGVVLDPSEIERETLANGETAFSEQKERDAAWSCPEQPGEPAAERENGDLVIAMDGVFTLGQRGRRGPKPRAAKEAAAAAAAEDPAKTEAASEKTIAAAGPPGPAAQGGADADAGAGPSKTQAASGETAASDPAFPAPAASFGREVKVGVVYGLSDRAKTAGGRPTLIDRRVVASAEGIETFGPRLKALACRWGWRRARRVVVLGDGAAWIWCWVLAFLGERAIQILDFWHAKDHLVTLGQKIFKATDVAAAWSQTQADRVRAGKVDDVIAELDEMARRRRGAAREAIRAEASYLRANRLRMRYPDYEAQGLPIGSGSVESLGKYLVRKRLCDGGMRWEQPGARAVVALRELHENGDWDRFWEIDEKRLLHAA